jgi:hypothetical protein
MNISNSGSEVTNSADLNGQSSPPVVRHNVNRNNTARGYVSSDEGQRLDRQHNWLNKVVVPAESPCVANNGSEYEEAIDSQVEIIREEYRDAFTQKLISAEQLEYALSSLDEDGIKWDDAGGLRDTDCPFAHQYWFLAWQIREACNVDAPPTTELLDQIYNDGKFHSTRKLAIAVASRLEDEYARLEKSNDLIHSGEVENAVASGTPPMTAEPEERKPSWGYQLSKMRVADVDFYAESKWAGNAQTTSVISFNWLAENLHEFNGPEFDPMWEDYHDSGKIKLRLLQKGAEQSEITWLESDEDYLHAQKFLGSSQAGGNIKWGSATFDKAHTVQGDEACMEYFIFLGKSCAGGIDQLTGQRSNIRRKSLNDGTKKRGLFFDADTDPELFRRNLQSRVKHAWYFRFGEAYSIDSLRRHLPELRCKSHHALGNTTVVEKFMNGKSIRTWQFIVLTDLLQITVGDFFAKHFVQSE